MHKCQYCGNTFSRHSTLTKHQNKAQYCKSLRLDHEVNLLRNKQMMQSVQHAPHPSHIPHNYINPELVTVELERTKTELQQLRQEREADLNKLTELINSINNNQK